MYKTYNIDIIDEHAAVRGAGAGEHAAPVCLLPLLRGEWGCALGRLDHRPALVLTHRLAINQS
jgi:hypothetical protein